jgi:hypothetical protein
MPDWTVKFEKLDDDGNIDANGEAGVVFMDELNTLPLHVQAAALGLSLDGRIGGGQLPKRVRRLAAMNETEDAAGGWDLAPALLNRFCWVPWVAPTETEFAAYWMGGAKKSKTVTDAATEEARVLAAWPAAWADVVGAVTAFVKRQPSMLKTTPKMASFNHLHAGIDATGLPTEASADFPTQWAVVHDWDKPGGVEASRNVVLVSMPSLIDPSMAPPGKHVIHAYVPATELFSDWDHLDRNSPEYLEKKKEAADFLWSAVEKYVPNARLRSDKRVEQIGTPLTHERFLRRRFGTYGPRIVAGEKTLPGHKTPLQGFYMTGDFTFPGIGVPAAASSGAITANTIMTVSQHLKILDKLRYINASPSSV